MRLSLPYPVSCNRYWRNFRGRQVVSAEARAYKSAAIAAAAGIQPLRGAVSVSMTLHPKRPKKTRPGAAVRCMDIDNALKVALDALNGVAYADDSQIARLLICRGAPIDGGGLAVEVTEE